MGIKLNANSYKKLVEEDLAWLAKMPRSLEREHIELILRQSPDMYYPSKAAEQRGCEYCNSKKPVYQETGTRCPVCTQRGCEYCNIEQPRYQEKGMTCPVCGKHGDK